MDQLVRIVCPICAKSFGQEKRFIAHMSSEHSIVADRDYYDDIRDHEGKRWCACGCEKKLTWSGWKKGYTSTYVRGHNAISFGKNKTIKTVRNVQQQRPRRCQICSKAFLNLGSYINHMKLSHNQIADEQEFDKLLTKPELFPTEQVNLQIIHDGQDNSEPLSVLWFRCTGGIYQIINKTNGKCYIGQTQGVVRDRVKSHVYDALYKGTKYPLYFAIKKYGVDNFNALILAQCNEKHKLDELEVKFIKQFDSLNSGYNQTPGGSGEGRIVNQETCSKISKSKKGIPQSEKVKENLRKPVKQINVQTGDVIKIWDSIGQVLNTLGINDVGRACRGELNGVGGFHWEYVNPRDLHRGSWSDERKEAMSKRLETNNHLNTGVRQLDMDGNLVKIWPSIKEAYAGTNISNISGQCRGIKGPQKGFRWEYVDETKCAKANSQSYNKNSV